MTRPSMAMAVASTALLAAIALLPRSPAIAAGLALEEVTPGVWAALQEDSVRFNDSNSVVIVAAHDVIVVDSQGNPATVRQLIADIRERTDKPIRYLVNTHFHSDHTRGNFIYRDEFPGLEIIGHPTLRDDISGRAAPELTKELELYRREIPAGEERLARGVDRAGKPLKDDGRATLTAQISAAKEVLADLESIEWAPPTLTVPESLTLDRNLGPIEIHSVHAHTRGDLVVLLPESGILITGDVLDDLPFGGHGYPGDWVSVLTKLESWDWEILIPGHGRVRNGADARSHLARVRSLFELMLSAARESVVAQTELETATDVFLESKALALLRRELTGGDPVADRNFERFVPATFERAVLEVRSELTD